MNLSFFVPTSFRENLLRANIDFDGSHTFGCWLMRPGFTFNSSVHLYRKNIIGTSTCTLAINATAKTLTRSDGGSFVTDGMVVGSYIVVDHANAPGQWVIRSINTLGTVLTVDAVDNNSLTNLTATQNILVSIDDEFPDGLLYTRPGTSGNQVSFDISGSVLKMTAIDLTSDGPFGTAHTVGLPPDGDLAPGFVVSRVSSGFYVVCYAKFSDWKIAY